MKVLTVAVDFGIGGTQRVAQNLTVGVQRTGAAVAVLAHGGRGPRERFFRESCIPVFAPDEDGLPNAHIREALQWRPDIVHIHRTGYPNERETRLMRAFRDQGARIVETNVFARYDGTEARHLIDVHCLLSRWCSVKWKMWRSACDDSAATILPNAVDVDRFGPVDEAQRQATRAALGVPRSRFLFGRIGQPISSKWSTKILPVFEQVLALGGDIGLLLVGAPDGYADRVAKLSSLVRERIVMLDPTEDDARLRSLFCAMDCFLHMAEIGESFGMVLCESMLCGTPVVTLSTPLKDNSQLEIVGHGRGGLVARDLAGVVEAMVRIQADASLRARVRKSGGAWVADRFGVDIVALKATKIYDAVVTSADKVDLQRRLDALGDAPPDFAWLDVAQRDGIGAVPTASQRALFRLVHSPRIYGSYQLVKRALARSRL